MPSGQEFRNTAIAVPISLPANQSVTIFDIKTFSSTPPVPANRRPASCSSQLVEPAIVSPPQAIRASPAMTTVLSP